MAVSTLNPEVACASPVVIAPHFETAKYNTIAAPAALIIGNNVRHELINVRTAVNAAFILPSLDCPISLSIRS